MDFAVVVVGGGVVGAAVAAELAGERGPILVLERAPRPAMGTTSRNSGVVHAGIHHDPRWLKSRLCVAGRRLLEERVAAWDVPYLRCGKFIVAQDDDEAEQLVRIERRGRRAGVEGLELLDAAECARREPEVRAHAALYSPVSGIVDPHRLVDALLERALERDVELLLGAELVGAAREGSGFVLAVREPDGGTTTCTASAVVNAAGLDADRVAGLFGIQEPQTFAKGDYWRVAPRHAGRVRHLIYPVPPPGLSGLGIHLTLDLGGGLRLGPDVQWLDALTDDYAVDESGRDRFFHAARRYLPFLEPEDLTPDLVGIRPKLSAEGAPPRDFLVREESARGRHGLVNLLGIESPGLTAALALARHVRSLLPP